MLLQAQLQHGQRLFVVFMAMREAQSEAAVMAAGALFWCQRALQHNRQLTSDALKAKGSTLQVSPMLVLPRLIQACTVGVHAAEEHSVF